MRHLYTRPLYAVVLVLALGLLTGPAAATAQTTGTVSGTVLDAESGDPLPGANVSITALRLGTTTDLDGRYRLTVPAGVHTLQVSFVGYGSERQQINVTNGATLTEDFSLDLDLIGAGEVVVLGTRQANRTVVESAVPVDVLTPKELESTGFSNTQQILAIVIPSYNAPQASITDGSDHVRPATLRGLAPDQTLILVNGKRRHTSALVHVNGSVGRGSTGTDLNTIPASSIERIEVLRDGAAAQYGSDAIAGVINIVLKETRGLDARVEVGQYLSNVTRGYTESEGNRPSDGPDSFSWDSPAESGGQRIGAPEDVTYTDGLTTNVHLGYGFGIGNGGSFYVSGQFRHRDFISRAGLDPRQQYYEGFLANPNFSPSFTEETFPRDNHRYGNGEFDDFSLFFNGSVPLNEDGLRFYTFGGASARTGLTGCFYRRSLDNRTVRAIYPDGFLPQINARVGDLSAAAGIRGATAGWAFDVSQTIGTNSFTFDMDNTHNTSVGTGPAQQTEIDSGTLRFAQATTNLDLYRDVEIGTAAPLSVAIGAEFRWENYGIEAGEELSFLNGGVGVLDGPNAGAGTASGAQCFPGFQPRSEQDENRTNFGVYADLQNNVTSQLLVSLAGRFENYSDFGSQATGKLAGRFELIPGLAVRGAASTGFRAPSLAQGFFTSIATNFIDGVPFEVGTFPVGSPVAQALGATELDPETSVNFSAGITFASSDVSITVDAYQIDIDDRITFTENFRGGDVAEFLAAQGINANGGRFFTNAVDTRTRGIDIIARYGRRIGDGTLRLTAAINVNETDVTNDVVDPDNPFVRNIPAPSELQALGVSSLINRSRINDFEDAQPRDKMSLMSTYDLGRLSVMLRLNRYGEYQEVNSGAPDPTTGINERDQIFGAKVLTDLEVSGEVVDAVRLAVGANNLFDVYPDRRLKANTFNGIFPYSGFSPFGFFGRYVYTRVSVAI
ncbi:MAG: TonB-dependent receptor [Bacteroidota bacterium]